MKLEPAPGKAETKEVVESPREITSIDAEALLYCVHSGGTVELFDTKTGEEYTLRSIPGSHPEKVVIMMKSDGTMSIIDAKNLQSGSIGHAEPGFKVGNRFHYESDQSGRVQSMRIAKIVITPGTPVAHQHEIKSGGTDRPRMDRLDLETIDSLSLQRYVSGGGTVEIGDKSGSVYTFLAVPGGSSHQVVMIRKGDGEIEVMDTKEDLSLGITIGRSYKFKKGIMDTDSIERILVNPGKTDVKTERQETRRLAS